MDILTIAFNPGFNPKMNRNSICMQKTGITPKSEYCEEGLIEYYEEGLIL